MRWPNASYSALSMVAGVMPKRAAVGRSITMSSARPFMLMSLGRTRDSGLCCSRSTSLGTQVIETGLLFGFSRKNWYWARLTVESIVRSCTGCIVQGDAGHGALSAQAAITAVCTDRAVRSSFGFRLIRIRPAFSVVLVPSTPMNEDRLSTAGSFRIASASAC